MCYFRRCAWPPFIHSPPCAHFHSLTLWTSINFQRGYFAAQRLRNSKLPSITIFYLWYLLQKRFVFLTLKLKHLDVMQVRDASGRRDERNNQSVDSLRLDNVMMRQEFPRQAKLWIVKSPLWNESAKLVHTGYHLLRLETIETKLYKIIFVVLFRCSSSLRVGKKFRSMWRARGAKSLWLDVISCSRG